MTARANHQGAGSRGSTLSRPVNGIPVHWDAAMHRALDQCVLADLPVTEIAERLGVHKHAVARGALLRVRALLRGPS